MNISITPGTGSIGFDATPLVAVPEPSMALLILTGTLILCLISVVHDLKVKHGTTKA